MEKRILIIDNPELLTKENVSGYAEVYTLFTADKEQYSVKNYICDFVEGAGNEE